MVAHCNPNIIQQRNITADKLYKMWAAAKAKWNQPHANWKGTSGNNQPWINFCQGEKREARPGYRHLFNSGVHRRCRLMPRLYTYSCSCVFSGVFWVGAGCSDVGCLWRSVAFLDNAPIAKNSRAAAEVLHFHCALLTYLLLTNVVRNMFAP